MEWYSMTKREALEKLKTSESGLTSAEAKLRLAANGKNALKEEKKSGLIGLFFAQFKDLMTLILVCAACLSAVLAYVTRDIGELADTGILLFIILLNAFVGFLQQYRADSAIEKLKKLSVATAKAVRDGKITVIDACDLVVGDVVEIAEGDRIPADCRVLESENFRCDESSLTGESKPVKKYDCVVKRSALAERSNTAHFSTFCVSGNARCVVTQTGMNTEMGAVAKLLRESAPALSPLDKIVTKLGKIISVTVLSVAALLFIGGAAAGRASFLDNLMTAIAVAVAAIPEGMGAVVTIILAMGVQRMSSARAVMRKLSAVETLGSCTCICSDKTGTLTQNRMSVSEIAPCGDEKRMIACMRVCHSVKGSAGGYVGDPTEVALVEYADRRSLFLSFRVLGGEPFTSERKMMSVAAQSDGKTKLYVKGGADVLLKKCAFIAAGEDARPLTRADKESVMRKAREFSSGAMRVIAFAEGEYRGAVQEESLTFLGLAALFDPPKEGAKEAVLSCKRAGIRTVMITGDSAETAFEIARRLGICNRVGETLTGEELDEMGEDFAKKAKNYRVFARVSPKHKLAIVRALQSQGEIVAMTGDGVNDAPSVRAADIGVAMGSGTDVTKNAADMVIADDDFSTMVGAVEEGRNVFFNVKRTISFFLSTNLAEVFAVLVATLVLWRYDFLTSTQLLWINLITDSLPVLALGVERTHGSMDRPPVNVNEIFSRRSVLFMFFFGAVQTAIVVAVFVVSLALWGNAVASTCAFLVLSLLELFHAFNVRKESGRLTLKEISENKTMLVTVAIGIVVNILLVAVPLLAELFDLTPLNAAQWLLVFACSAAIIPVGEIYKAVVRPRPVNMRKKRILVHDNIR